jgi:hypothetical protein
MSKETDFQRDVYERLSWEPGIIPFRFNCGQMKGLGGGVYWAVTWGADRTHTGVGDVAALVNGQRIEFIELKVQGGKRRASQIVFAEAIAAEGGEVHLAKDMDDIEAIIKKIKGIYPR